MIEGGMDVELLLSNEGMNWIMLSVSGIVHVI
jgi:hypothetical protein